MQHFNEYTDRVLLIDNKENEIRPLQELLTGLDIDVSVYNTRTTEEFNFLKKSRQLIFVDLMLDENVDNAKGNISQLVSILCKIIPCNFGTYGLIAWTKHSDYIEILRKDIEIALNSNTESNDVPSDEDLSVENVPVLNTAPMFITYVDKTKYIEKGSYEELFDDIEKALSDNLVGYFLMSWTTSVKSAICKTIADVFSITDSFTKSEKQIEYMLCCMAKNYTGSPIETDEILSVDSYKAFDEMLYANLFVLQREEKSLKFSEDLNCPWEQRQKQIIEAKLNTLFFIDPNAISQQIIVPGNVYKVKGGALQYAIDDKIEIKNCTYDAIDIAIELTPPCDFSNKKKLSRVVYGYMIKINEQVSAKKKELDNKLKGDNKYCVKIFLEGELQEIVFDFRYLHVPMDENLKNESMYEILFRVKPKLFADILQKFSSHAARVGLSDIHFE